MPFSDGIHRSHATYYFIVAGETHNRIPVPQPVLPSYRVLHSYGKSQEGSGAIGCMSCPDGNAETWSN